MDFIANTLKDIDSIAEKLLQLNAGKKVFAFYGKMGVGKTTFIKSICSQLMVKETAISPSFAIINEYITTSCLPVFHFDFYRIKSITEFLDLGCEEYFYSDSYCFIEWPEKIEDFLPEEHIPVYIEESEGKRFIKF